MGNGALADAGLDRGERLRERSPPSCSVWTLRGVRARRELPKLLPLALLLASCGTARIADSASLSAPERTGDGKRWLPPAYKQRAVRQQATSDGASQVLQTGAVKGC